MLEVDIKDYIKFDDFGGLFGDDNYLKKSIPDNVVIVGKVCDFTINHTKYDKLDLSNVECNEIKYENQKGNSIKNHILPNTLKFLHCENNQLTSLPDHLPDSLIVLYCENNQLTSLPDHLPNSLENLCCDNNQLTSLPDHLPNSLQYKYCNDNQLITLPNLPNSIISLKCSNNQLTSIVHLKFPNSLERLFLSHNKIKIIPSLPENINFIFYQNEPVDYIEYSKNIRTCTINIENFKLIINDIVITNQREWDNYMNLLLRNKVKSARK